MSSEEEKSQDERIGVGVYKCNICGEEYQDKPKCRCKFETEFSEKVTEIFQELWPQRDPTMGLTYADLTKFGLRCYRMGA